MRASGGSPSGAGPRSFACDYQVGRARLHAHDSGFAFARSKPRFPFQFEFARAREEASGPLCGKKSIHRRRRHHPRHFRNGIDRSVCASGGEGLYPFAPDSVRVQLLQRTCLGQRSPGTGTWPGSRFSRLRAHLLDRWRFAHHDFKSAESLRPPFRLRQAGEAHAGRTEDPLFSFSTPWKARRRKSWTNSWFATTTMASSSTKKVFRSWPRRFRSTPLKPSSICLGANKTSLSTLERCRSASPWNCSFCERLSRGNCFPTGKLEEPLRIPIMKSAPVPRFTTSLPL